VVHFSRHRVVVFRRRFSAVEAPRASHIYLRKRAPAGESKHKETVHNTEIILSMGYANIQVLQKYPIPLNVSTHHPVFSNDGDGIHVYL